MMASNQSYYRSPDPKAEKLSHEPFMSHCQPFNASLQDAVFLLSAGESVIYSEGRVPCSPREQTSEAMEQDGRGHWGRRKAPHGECRTLLNIKLACLLMKLVCCYHQSW